MTHRNRFGPKGALSSCATGLPSVSWVPLRYRLASYTTVTRAYWTYRSTTDSEASLPPEDQAGLLVTRFYSVSLNSKKNASFAFIVDCNTYVYHTHRFANKPLRHCVFVDPVTPLVDITGYPRHPSTTPGRSTVHTGSGAPLCALTAKERGDDPLSTPRWRRHRRGLTTQMYQPLEITQLNPKPGLLPIQL